MKRINKLLRLVPALLVLTLSAPAGAEDIGPQIPKAVQGEECILPADEMRRSHMDQLRHDRDQTLRLGNRDVEFSLKACIACHVDPTEETVAGTQIEGPEFCKSCHDFAGVRLDCFECHTTRPEQSAMFHPLVTPGMQTLRNAQQPDTAAFLNDLADGNK